MFNICIQYTTNDFSLQKHHLTNYKAKTPPRLISFSDRYPPVWLKTPSYSAYIIVSTDPVGCSPVQLKTNKTNKQKYDTGAE